jgi:hypothetical protein
LHRNDWADRMTQRCTVEDGSHSVTHNLTMFIGRVGGKRNIA